MSKKFSPGSIEDTLLSLLRRVDALEAASAASPGNLYFRGAEDGSLDLVYEKEVFAPEARDPIQEGIWIGSDRPLRGLHADSSSSSAAVAAESSRALEKIIENQTADAQRREERVKDLQGRNDAQFRVIEALRAENAALIAQVQLQIAERKKYEDIVTTYCGGKL